MLGIFTAVCLRASTRAVAHLPAIEPGERPERKSEYLAPEEQVRRHVEIVGQGQVLEHGFDAGLARLERVGEMDLLAVDEDLTAGLLFDAR